MKHYVIFGSDKPGALALRQAARELHRSYIRETNAEQVTVVFAGPTLGDDQAMNGTLLVVLAPSKEAVQRFVAADPYSQAGIFESLEIREMRAGLVRPEILGNT